MLDLLLALRANNGTANPPPLRCPWQDLSPKLDNSGKQVALTAAYIAFLQKLRTGAPAAIEALSVLTSIIDATPGHSPDSCAATAARDARIARGWLQRLINRDWISSTWEADYSRLSGFEGCLTEAVVGVDGVRRGRKTSRQGESAEGEDGMMRVLQKYIGELAGLETETQSVEWARTTFVEKVLEWGVDGAMAVLGMSGGLRSYGEDDGFWNEDSVMDARVA